MECFKLENVTFFINLVKLSIHEYVLGTSNELIILLGVFSVNSQRMHLYFVYKIMAIVDIVHAIRLHRVLNQFNGIM